MTLAPLHREDIKAELRKRHRTVHAFAETRGLKPQAVADWLRGRTNAQVAKAVAKELGVETVHFDARESIKLDDSASSRISHRLNAGAR